MTRRIVLLTLLFGAALPAPAWGDGYRRCAPVDGTSLVAVARTSCVEAELLAATLAAAPADAAASAARGAGWTALRARAVPRRRPLVHDLVLLRGTAAVRVRRPGGAPDLDGLSAGRELIFARASIVGGRPVPRDAAFCTASFLVRLRGGMTGGLSAAHCAGRSSDGTVQRRNVAVRRPPASGIVLGRVQRDVSRGTSLDALIVPATPGTERSTAAVVDRGVSRPPWAVVGIARPLAGRAVCFGGRTSGVDRCGRLTARDGTERILRRFGGLTVSCTTIPAAQGDSGGPVFTRPASDGTTRALGIVTLIVGPRSRMCFTPIGPVLRRLGATVLTATVAGAPVARASAPVLP